MEDLLRQRLAGQRGVLTSGDARQVGLSSRAIATLVSRGTLVRVARSTYVDGSLHRDGSPEQRHALTARALQRAHPTWLVSHYSALTVLGVPVYAVDLGRHHLQRSHAGQSRRGALVSVHGPVAGPRWRSGTTLTVSPAAAIIGTALVAGAEAAVVSADAAIRQGLTTPQDLAEQLARLATRPGRAVARRVLRLVDGLAESPGESRTRLLLVAVGYQVASQVEVRDAHGVLVGRADFQIKGTRVLVEFDGLVKYGGIHGREALAREKRREDALRALGYEVVRLVWADLADPARVVRLVEAAISRSRSAVRR